MRHKNTRFIILITIPEALSNSPPWQNEGEPPVQNNYGEKIHCQTLLEDVNGPKFRSLILKRHFQCSHMGPEQVLIAFIRV